MKNKKGRVDRQKNRTDKGVKQVKATNDTLGNWLTKEESVIRRVKTFWEAV